MLIIVNEQDIITVANLQKIVIIHIKSELSYIEVLFKTIIF